MPREIQRLQEQLDFERRLNTELRERFVGITVTGVVPTDEPTEGPQFITVGYTKCLPKVFLHELPPALRELDYDRPYGFRVPVPSPEELAAVRHTIYRLAMDLATHHKWVVYQYLEQ